MAERFKKKQDFPECNKEAVTLSLRQLQESIIDLTNSRGCPHVRNKENLISSDHQDNEKGIYREKDVRRRYGNRVDHSREYLKDNIENLNPEQLSNLKCKLLHNLKKKKNRVKNDNDVDAEEGNCNNKHLDTKKSLKTSNKLKGLNHNSRPQSAPRFTETSNTNVKSLGVHSKGCNRRVRPALRTNKNISTNKTTKKLVSKKCLAAPTNASNTNPPTYSNPPTNTHISTTIPHSTTKFKMNISGLPFISGQSTSKSHSLSANLQEVLYLMKHTNTKTFSTKSFSSTCHRSCLCHKHQQHKQQHLQQIQQQDLQQIQQQHHLQQKHNQQKYSNKNHHHHHHHQETTNISPTNDKHIQHPYHNDEGNDFCGGNDNDEGDDDSSDDSDDNDGSYDNDRSEDNAMLKELIKQLVDELSNLKARHDNLVGLEGYEDGLRILKVKIHTKQKQIMKVKEFLKEQQISTGHSEDMSRSTLVGRAASGRVKVQLKGASSAGKAPSCKPPTTAKQRYIRLLNDLKQIQNSLKSDVR